METSVIRPIVAPVEVRDAGPGKGRGVFATAPIARGTIIETVPVIVLSKENYAEHGQHTELAHYTFCWPGGGQAVALGLTGSMWNHRVPPNVGFIRNAAAQTITFSAVEPIAAGEECCIDYGRHLWFDASGEAADGVGAGSHEADDDDSVDFLSRVVIPHDDEGQGLRDRGGQDAGPAVYETSDAAVHVDVASGGGVVADFAGQLGL